MESYSLERVLVAANLAIETTNALCYLFASQSFSRIELLFLLSSA